MGYVGVPPQSGFITTAKQRVTGSTNNYVDLDHSISSLADVIVWVNFVKQDSTNLSLTTSTRITLGGTLVSSDIVEIAYLGKAVATQTPDTGTVTNDMLAGSIANSKLANSSITLNGSAVSLGGSATVGGDNTPSFYAQLTSNQSMSNNTWTKVQFNSEDFDTDNTYDNSTNYRFTPAVAGKYYVFSAVTVDAGGADRIYYAQTKIYKNGSEYSVSSIDYTNSLIRQSDVVIFSLMDLNTTDYVEIYSRVNNSTGVPTIQGTSGRPTFFGANKIIT